MGWGVADPEPDATDPAIGLDLLDDWAARADRYTPSLDSADRLTATGIHELAEDAGPDARRAVLDRWVAQLNGDQVQAAGERTELVRLGLPAKEVDAALAAWRRAKAPERDVQGRALPLVDPEPWPHAINGERLVEVLASTFDKYLAAPGGADVAFALWTLHAHAHDAAEISPVLALTSPEKRCGKTTALSILEAVVPRPLPAASLTPATIYRSVEKFGPTLLVDEADTFINGHEELRGVLNSGHRRQQAIVVRCVGDDHEVRQFSTWGPKAIALIGRLPSTLADRSIEIRMRRRLPGEEVHRLRLDRLSRLEPLRRQAWRWATDHLEELRGADPDVPAQLHDRARDNWRPLLAIADLAGGEWPTRARQVIASLASDEVDEGSAGVLMLSDLRDLFERRDVDRVASSQLTDALHRMEERPWPEWGRSQRPITARGIARLLGPFGISPGQLWIDGGKSRGYTRDACEEAFARYLPSDPPSPSGRTVDAAAARDDSADRHPVGSDNPTGSETPQSPQGFGVPTDLPGGNGGPGADGDPGLWDSLLSDEEGSLADVDTDLEQAIGGGP